MEPREERNNKGSMAEEKLKLWERKRGGIKEVRKGWKNGEGVGKQWRVGYQRIQRERRGKSIKKYGWGKVW